MSSAQKRYRLLQRSMSALVMLVTTTALVSSESAALRQINDYTAHITYSLLALGLIALIVRLPQLMATSLACCALMCIYLKDAGNDNLRFATISEGEQLTVGQFNLSSVNTDYPEMLRAIEDSDVDILSFQEVDPRWSTMLQRDLSQQYNYNHTVARIDPYGLALYSRVPLYNIDTFHTGSFPHMTASILMDEQSMTVISSYVTPALDAASNKIAREQLQDIRDWVRAQRRPCIAVGDYNMVYWTSDLKDFKNEATLVQSRRESTPSFTDLPQEHIFYSRDLECTSFGHLYTDEKTYVGVQGTYQHKPLSEYQTSLIHLQEKAVVQ